MPKRVQIEFLRQIIIFYQTILFANNFCKFLSTVITAIFKVCKTEILRKKTSFLKVGKLRSVLKKSIMDSDLN